MQDVPLSAAAKRAGQEFEMFVDVNLNDFVKLYM
jgi:hypothetical protein